MTNINNNKKVSKAKKPIKSRPERISYSLEKGIELGIVIGNTDKILEGVWDYYIHHDVNFIYSKKMSELAEYLVKDLSFYYMKNRMFVPIKMSTIINKLNRLKHNNE